jgi:hypothetical protein
MIKYYKIRYLPYKNGIVDYRAIPAKGASYGVNRLEAIKNLRLFLRAINVDPEVYIVGITVAHERDYYEFVNDANFWVAELKRQEDKR